MLRLKVALFVVCLAFSCTGAAQAGDLQLSGAMRWLALASSKDKDVAIGIARRVGGLSNTVKVVSAKNGYYAVIAGPYQATSIQDLKHGDTEGKFSDLPPDALLSQGANYTDKVWELNRDAGLGFVPYAVSKTASFSAGPFSVKVSAAKLDSENAYTVVDGKDAVGSFHFDIGKDVPEEEMATLEALSSLDYNKAAVARLLPGEGSPQVIITNYSGGAHCCTSTTIAARDGSSAAWTLVNGDTLDGDGYWYEDVDGDGALELLSVDNSFLYAFDSYAGSFAPIKISKLRGGKLEEVSGEPAYRSRLVQDLAGMEYDAKVHPDNWKSNGFLAAWVAAKVRLGQGDAAWAKFLANFDRQSSFGPQVCTTGGKVENCPDDKLQAVPIPKALAQHLQDNGYLPLPKAAEALLK